MPTQPDPATQARTKFDTPSPPGGLDIVLRYATDPPLAIRTLLDAIRPATTPGARICELGFGSGWLLEEMRTAFPETRLHGLDMSRTFAHAAHAAHGNAVRIALGDMERLPFRDDSLDAIVTCWTLFFINDIDRAVAEAKRCLKPGAVFVAATIAPDHMREFDALVTDAVRAALGRDRDPDIAYRFDTETGAAYIERAFPDHELHEWRGEMPLPDIDSVMALWPNYGPQLTGAEDTAARTEFERLARARIANEGAFHITRHDGAFIARA